MTDLKLLLTANILLAVSLVGLMYLYTTKPHGYFSTVDVKQLHTMRVYEDGSYVIVHQDNTSEIGCVPGGLCNE